MSGDIPLVKTGLPIIIMKPPSRIPHVPINFTIQGNSALAFVYNNINLELTLTTPVQTTCGGYMCDRQRVSDWNGVHGCGCFDMSNYRSNLAFEHSIHFDTNTGKIAHQNFSSHPWWWTLHIYEYKSIFYLQSRRNVYCFREQKI